MPNPTPPRDDNESLDKSSEPKEKEQPTLSFGDTFSSEKHERHQVDKASYSYSFGQLPELAFRLHKSEFPQDEEKKLDLLKLIVNNFLNETETQSAGHLPVSEKEELLEARKALHKFDSLNDLLKKAVNLAKIYQELRYIEEARKAVNLSLGIDPDDPQVKELFKEMEHMHPVEIGLSQKQQSELNLSKSNLRKCIRNMSSGKVIVLGDLLIDELVEGKPERISREAPVLILEHVVTELIPGGAANTANNIASLGGKCHAIGVCGNDDYASKLAGLFDRAGITHGLVLDPHRPTTVKTRILSKSHSFKQQLLRMDRISHEKITGITESLLADKIEHAGPNYAALVISDYRAGVVTNRIIDTCMQVAKKNNLVVIVDAQDKFERFKDTNLMTPNQPDVESVVGFTIDSKEALQKAGDKILSMTNSKAVLITRGAHGMVLFQPQKDMIELPVFNKSEVFDVTGAGDTVVATMALALITGSTNVEAMALGNLAAGIVVKKPGTAVTNQKEMLDALESVNLPE